MGGIDVYVLYLVWFGSHGLSSHINLILYKVIISRVCIGNKYRTVENVIFGHVLFVVFVGRPLNDALYLTH